MNLHPSVMPLIADMTQWRHHLHAHPEIGFQEVQTAAFVARHLRGWGIEVTDGVGGTGIVGTLHGSRGPGKAIGIRAELDALPMTEARPLAHASQIPGRMHGCGRDGHMAILLGAAKALAASPDFAGTVHFIFQPAEEGLGGAKAMLADGLFERFHCDEIYALHNFEAELGHVHVHHGVVAAAADRFFIELRGTGGHAAYPHLAVNPLPAAARLLLALESLPARVTNALCPVVVTVASLVAGEAFNTIPDVVQMAGTVRSLDASARVIVEREIYRQVEAQATAERLSFVLDYQSPFAVTENDPNIADHLISVAGQMLGAGCVHVDPAPEMGSEDFCFMLQQRPGCYFMIGQGDIAHTATVHDTMYDFNDALLPIGASLWIQLVESRLADTTTVP